MSYLIYIQVTIPFSPGSPVTNCPLTNSWFTVRSVLCPILGPYLLGPSAFLKGRFPATGAPQCAPALRVASEARQLRSECCVILGNPLFPGDHRWRLYEIKKVIRGKCLTHSNGLYLLVLVSAARGNVVRNTYQPLKKNNIIIIRLPMK